MIEYSILRVLKMAREPMGTNEWRPTSNRLSSVGWGGTGGHCWFWQCHLLPYYKERITDHRRRVEST